MITVQKAREYANLLHPAFAGYYHDGIIHESDALAAVFHLIKQGYIEPEFKNHDITQGISHLRAKARGPHHRFEKNIVRVIFYESNRVSAKYVGDLIKHHAIQAIIASAATINANTIIPPHTKSLHHTVKVTAIHNQNRKLVNVVTWQKSPYLYAGIVLVLLALIFYFAETYSGKHIFIGVAGVFCIIFSLLGFSPDRIISSQVIIHPYTHYYTDLHEFLKAHPPQPHTFTYEFIPYAIAFNLDTSWHADFNLSPRQEPRP